MWQAEKVTPVETHANIYHHCLIKLGHDVTILEFTCTVSYVIGILVLETVKFQVKILVSDLTAILHVCGFIRQTNVR